MNNQLTRYERIADQKRLNFITQTVIKKLKGDGRVLDIGCGNGIISSHIGQYGIDVTGIDVSEKAIVKARENNPFPNVKYRAQSAEGIVASGEQFDIIICSEVLEHLNDPNALVNVLYNSLKDGGSLIVTVPNGFGPREKFVTKPVLYLKKKNGALWKTLCGIKNALGYSGTTVQSSADNLDHIQFFRLRDLHRIAKNNHFYITTLRKANFIEDVFPFSIITKRITLIQKIDCKLADWLPSSFTGGFFTIWEKR